MFAVCVSFAVAPDHFDAFLPLMRGQATTSIELEAGCHRFDICIDAAARQVFLYELYADLAAFASHLESPHFRAFDADVASMILEKTVQTFDRVEMS